MILVQDFFNKFAIAIRGKYFPNVEHCTGSTNYIKTTYTIECFSNGVLPYDKMIKQLAKSCGTNGKEIEKVVSEFIALTEKKVRGKGFFKMTKSGKCDVTIHIYKGAEWLAEFSSTLDFKPALKDYKKDIKQIFPESTYMTISTTPAWNYKRINL